MSASINARLHEIALVAASLFVLLMLTSCGTFGARSEPTATPVPPPTYTPAAPTPTSTPTITPTPEPEVFVIPSGTEMEKRTVFSEPIPQNNCGGTSEAKTTIGKSRTLKYELDVGGEFTVYGEGEIGVPGIGRVKAGAAVAAQYNVGYGTAEEKRIDVELKAASKTRVEHQLTHYELWDNGVILVTFEDQEVRIPYKFPREYRIEYVTIELPCPTEVAESPIRDVTPEGNQPDLVPTLVIQPTPSATQVVGSNPTLQPNPQSSTEPQCTPPTELIPLWKDVDIPWSTGVWGSPNMVAFIEGLGSIDSDVPGFGAFEMWLDPCSANIHGYGTGGRFWSESVTIAVPPFVPLGGDIATTVNLPPNTGVWGFGVAESSSTTSTCPSSPEAAAALFGGSPSFWQRMSDFAWKYGPAPGAPIANLYIPEGTKGDWWNDVQQQSRVGPANVGFASEATIWCTP